MLFVCLFIYFFEDKQKNRYDQNYERKSCFFYPFFNSLNTRERSNFSFSVSFNKQIEGGNYWVQMLLPWIMFARVTILWNELSIFLMFYFWVQHKRRKDTFLCVILISKTLCFDSVKSWVNKIDRSCLGRVSLIVLSCIGGKFVWHGRDDSCKACVKVNEGSHLVKWSWEASREREEVKMFSWVQFYDYSFTMVYGNQ